TSRQCLENIERAVLADGIAQMRAIADNLAIDKHRDVLAQSPLVIEDIAARLRIILKHPGQHFAYGMAAGLRLGAGYVALNIGREDNPRHLRVSPKIAEAHEHPPE